MQSYQIIKLPYITLKLVVEILITISAVGATEILPNILTS